MGGTALMALLLAGCQLLGTSGPSGRYETSPGSGYGFEFDNGTVYSLVGGDITRGTYTVDGTTVRFCISIRCADLKMVGDCLVQADGGRYCKG